MTGSAVTQSYQGWYPYDFHVMPRKRINLFFRLSIKLPIIDKIHEIFDKKICIEFHT